MHVHVHACVFMCACMCVRHCLCAACTSPCVRVPRYSTSTTQQFLYRLGRTPTITHVLRLPCEARVREADGALEVWKPNGSDRRYTGVDQETGVVTYVSLPGGDLVNPWVFTTPHAATWAAHIEKASKVCTHV